MERWPKTIFALTVILFISFSIREMILAGQKAGQELLLTRDIQPILTMNCAVPECHTGPKPAKGLVLDSAVAFGNLVNIKSKESPRQMRVAPGDLKRSYLYDKLTGNHSEGDRMPPKERLPKESIELIKSWILAGTPGDSTIATEDSSQVNDGKQPQQTHK